MNFKKRWAVLSVLLAVLPEAVHASRVENPLFGYTHLLPSPFTLQAGRLALGTDIVLGVTDFLQVGTNVLRDVYQVYNVHGKVALIDHEEFALAFTAEYETFNYKDILAGNPDLRVTSVLPGLVLALATPIPDVAFFMGGNLNYTNANLVTSGVATSGYVQGARFESDLSWAYNPPKKKAGMGNVLSTGVSYDLTYKLMGLGVSHHWSGFHLGIHYYPNATQYRVQPILSGSAAIDL